MCKITYHKRKNIVYNKAKRAEGVQRESYVIIKVIVSRANFALPAKFIDYYLCRP